MNVISQENIDNPECEISLKGLECLVLGCEFAKNLKQVPSEENKETLNNWQKSSISRISSIDIESYNGIELCELALTLDEENPTTKLLHDLIFTNSPSAVVALGDKVRESGNTQALELLFSIAQNEVMLNVANNACRILATLLYSSIIEKQDIPTNIVSAINSLENGIHLLHRVSKIDPSESPSTLLKMKKIWPASKIARKFIDFCPRPGISRDVGILEELGNQVIEEGTSFKETLKILYQALTDSKTSTEDRINSYNKLLILQGNLINKIAKDNIEEILPIILSTPGLMQDLYSELGRIEVFSDNNFGLWIRAGLKSPWYRDQCVDVLIHAAIFGIETSDLRIQMFEALKNGEITHNEILSIAEKKYGVNAADGLWANIEDMESHFSASGTTPLNFIRRERKPIEWIIKPSIDRIFDTAVHGIKKSLAYSDVWPNLDWDAEKFRDRIIANLDSKTYDDLFSWAKSLGWNLQVIGDQQEIFNCLQALYIQHSLIRYRMPIAKRSVSNSVTRANMADVVVAAKFRHSHLINDAELDPRVISLFHSISTGSTNPFDDIVLDLCSTSSNQRPKESKNSNMNSVLEELHSSITSEFLGRYNRFIIPLTSIMTDNLVITIDEENNLEVFASGRQVHKVKNIQLSDGNAISYQYGTKRAHYSSEKYSIVDTDSGEIILDRKNLKGDFFMVTPPAVFCYHSAYQDNYILGEYYQADSIKDPFGIFFGGSSSYTDLISVFELGQQFSQSTLDKTTSAVEKEFSEENGGTVNITRAFTLTHLFDLENGDRYAICQSKKDKSKFYIMPLKISGLN